MDKRDMTFSEIQSNWDAFLRQNDVADLLAQSQMSRESLMEIGNDYEAKCYGDGRDRQEYRGPYYQMIQDCIAKIASFERVHSYRFRIKRTESLLAKLIRKSVEHNTVYTKDNYFQEITDLLGVRLLYVFKEDYWPVHEQIMGAYRNRLAQDITLKLKQGDDEEMYALLLQRHSNTKVERNETYRSIHYTLYADPTHHETSPRIELQTRTIFEEGWSEINHKLVYKKGSGNPGLKNTSTVLSSMVGACDSLGTLMKNLYDTGIQATGDETADMGASSEKEYTVEQVIRKFLLE